MKLLIQHDAANQSFQAFFFLVIPTISSVQIKGYHSYRIDSLKGQSGMWHLDIRH